MSGSFRKMPVSKQDTLAELLGTTTGGFDSEDDGRMPEGEAVRSGPPSAPRRKMSRGSSFAKKVTINVDPNKPSYSRSDTLANMLAANTGDHELITSVRGGPGGGSASHAQGQSFASDSPSFNYQVETHPITIPAPPPEPLGEGESERSCLVVHGSAFTRALGPLEARGLRLIGVRLRAGEAGPEVTMVLEGVGAVASCMRVGAGLGASCVRLCATLPEALTLIMASFAPESLIDQDTLDAPAKVHPPRAIAQSGLTIDLDDLSAAEPGSPLGLAFCAALRVEGYVHVAPPAFTFELLRRLEEAAAVWFAQDMETKEADCAAHAYGHVDGKYTGFLEGKYREQLEVRLEAHGGVVPAPASVEDFPALLAQAVAALELHGRALLKHIAHDLGVDYSWLEELLDVGEPGAEPEPPAPGLAEGDAVATPQLRHSLMRLCRYVAGRPGVGGSNIQCDDHTDVGFITLDAHACCPGLQVLRRADHVWVNVESEAEPISCAVVAVLVGDTLDKVSGGRYEATRHRVLAPEEGERIGLPFLLRGRLDAVVDTREPRAAAAARGAAVHLAAMESTAIRELPTLDAAQSILKNWFKASKATKAAKEGA